MLRYLDNAENARGHINENYAREIMELHTMGVGSGYTQEDVQELARILTGVGINFKCRGRSSIWARKPTTSGPARSNSIPTATTTASSTSWVTPSREAALPRSSRLSISSPAIPPRPTISATTRDLFVADAPPPALVLRMAQTFQKTDGDIASVLGADVPLG